MKALRDILIVLALIFAIFVVWRKVPQRTEVEYLPADTVVRFDTIRDTILVPVRVTHLRTDTVMLRVPGDTVFVAVEVPIERRTYRTDDYKAVVEGFQPALVEMEVYPRTVTITRPEVRYAKARQRWGIGIQAGYGISFGGSDSSGGAPKASHASHTIRLRPYIGVGLQYNLISW